MAWSGRLGSAAIGVAGTTAVFAGPDSLKTYAWGLVQSLVEALKAAGPSAVDSRALLTPQALVSTIDGRLEAALARMERASSRAVHVVHGGGNSRQGVSGVAVLIVSVGGGLVSYYLVRAKYVTAERMAEAVSTVTAGVAGVKKSVNKLRVTVLDKLGFLTGRVEHNIEQVDAVKQSVEALQGELGSIQRTVEGCEQHLLEASVKQDVTIRGVALLCGVVADSLQSSQARNKLEQYVNDTAAQFLPPLEHRSPARRKPPRSTPRKGRNQRIQGSLPAAVASPTNRPFSNEEQDGDFDSELSDSDAGPGNNYESGNMSASSFEEEVPPPPFTNKARSFDFDSTD